MHNFLKSSEINLNVSCAFIPISVSVFPFLEIYLIGG